MPSFDAAHYQLLAQQLRVAADTQDWARLGQLDTLIRRWIDAANGAALNVTEKDAWQQVVHAHTYALKACQVARQEAAAQLQQLQNSQEAQKAYAWQEVLG